MKLTRKQLKIGFWSSLTLTVLIFFLIGYQHYIPIQFTSETARSNAQGALVIAVPVLVFTTMGIHYRLYHIKGLPVLHVIFGTILAIGLFIFSGLMSFFSPQWSDQQVLYEGRFTNKEIILQKDSWNYKERTIRATPLVSGIRYIAPVDTTSLPEHKWIKSSRLKNSN